MFESQGTVNSMCGSQQNAHSNQAVKKRKIAAENNFKLTKRVKFRGLRISEPYLFVLN